MGNKQSSNQGVKMIDEIKAILLKHEIEDGEFTHALAEDLSKFILKTTTNARLDELNRVKTAVEDQDFELADIHQERIKYLKNKQRN